MRALAFLLFIVAAAAAAAPAGCAATAVNAPPPQTTPAATAQAETLGAPADASPEELAFTTDYDDAVTRAEKDDLGGAYDVLSRRAAALETAGRFDLASICWNTTTWVRWAQGDLAGALGENSRLAQSLARSDVEAQKVLNLHYVWDRAYLLRDKADKVPATERGKALSEAEAMREEYHHIAPADEPSGGAVLDAYFAWRAGDAKAAAAAARQVDLENDKDAQDLFIAALAIEAGGDHATADKLRTRIGEARYMMPPLLRHWRETSSNR
jgi:hypothetical protein